MYAIVEILGMQVKVEPGKKVWVPYMSKREPGDELDFDKVFLIAGDGDAQVGQPTVAGAKVTATLVEHRKGPKLIVFRKRRRKGFHKKKGHRQDYSVLKIEKIEAK